MPGRHPDDDLLADLAADVLPLDQARMVEAHVMECERCAALLSDAERLRALLLADEPGPVPPRIWDRIEAALEAEASGRPSVERRSSGGGVHAGSGPAAGPAAATSRPDAAGPRPAEGAGWDGPDPLDDPDTWQDAPHRSRRVGSPGSVPPVTGSLTRLTTSRRDSRGDRRDGRRRWLSPAVLAAAAAAALVAVVGTVRLAQSGGNAVDATAGLASGSSAASGEPESASGARILASGTRYTTAALRTQARALLPAQTGGEAMTHSGAGAGVAAPRATPAPTRGAPVPAPAAAGSRSTGTVTPDPRATDIRSPARLAACLAALDTGQERLVTVDLATFDGREAAVLVLQATTGGYEVFVVERSCAPGQEGTIDYATLPG
ncbi:MAG: hypothetical protein ACXV1K_10895 [Kineosporiaceae bacterium]